MVRWGSSEPPFAPAFDPSRGAAAHTLAPGSSSASPEAAHASALAPGGPSAGAGPSPGTSPSPAPGSAPGFRTGYGAEPALPHVYLGASDAAACREAISLLLLARHPRRGAALRPPEAAPAHPLGGTHVRDTAAALAPPFPRVLNTSALGSNPVLSSPPSLAPFLSHSLTR
jgi:hypothetical protein